MTDKPRFPWTLTGDEIEAAERWIKEWGLASWLDHIGLDGAANRVVAAERVILGTTRDPDVDGECDRNCP